MIKNIRFLTSENGRVMGVASQSAQPIFKSVSISSGGEDQVNISEVNGALDLGGKQIQNIGLVGGRDVAIDGSNLDSHIDGSANNHEAIDILFSNSEFPGAASVEDGLIQTMTVAKAALPKAGGNVTGDIALVNAQISTSSSSFSSNNLVPKNYVDFNDVEKQSVSLASVSNIDLSSTDAEVISQGLDLIGEEAADLSSLGDSVRILIKDQEDASENGIYSWEGSSLSRTEDLTSPGSVLNQGITVYVQNGDSSGGTKWTLSSLGTLGISNVVWRLSSRLGMTPDDTSTSIVQDKLSVKTWVEGISGETIAKNKAVYLDQATGKFNLASNSTAMASKHIGISRTSAQQDQGILIEYKAGAVISGFSGLTPGGSVYLGSNGSITQTVPSPTPGSTIYSLGYAISSSVILYIPSPAVEIV